MIWQSSLSDDAMSHIEDYYNKIQSGEIVTSKRVKQIYERLVNEIHNPGIYHFNEELANRPIEFVERFCKHSKGQWAGSKVELMLFQKAFLQALFGFVDDKGIRRFKESFFLVARKNGKSFLLSAILLYMLIADEMGAECYTVGVKKDQAKITFTECCNMVSQSQDLTKILKKRKTDVYFPSNFSKLEALASDSNSLDGLNSSCVVADEIHAWKDRNLYEVMKQSQSARQQPLLVMITTAGTVRECIYDDMYRYSCDLLDGTIINDRFLPILYELDDVKEWTDETKWDKANPALRVIKKLDDLQEKVEKAKVVDSDLSGILCKDFNMMQNSNESFFKFDQIVNEELFNVDDFKNSYCIGGVDLSSTTDLTCATLLFIKPNSNKKYIHQMYWIPEQLIEKRSKEDRIPYDIWHKRGWLRTSPGNRINYNEITAWFLEMFNDYGFRPLYIGYDPWGSQYWTDDMVDNHGFNLEKVRQGAQTLSQPMKELKAEILSKDIVYNNNPLLKWNLCNVVAETDKNGNIQPVKGKNQKLRIDGFVSLLISYTVYFAKMNELKSLI